MSAQKETKEERNMYFLIKYIYIIYIYGYASKTSSDRFSLGPIYQIK